ncbi:Dynamin-2B [Vitis vinifera]|uniref:Dynamin-2B n=1 Tax=Vitis vinifera TaxID=29760 RepID=A0A438E9U5_VITVI|nr:Dynamin-2B [Vitis vinifera]
MLEFLHISRVVFPSWMAMFVVFKVLAKIAWFVSFDYVNALQHPMWDALQHPMSNVIFLMCQQPLARASFNAKPTLAPMLVATLPLCAKLFSQPMACVCCIVAHAHHLLIPFIRGMCSAHCCTLLISEAPCCALGGHGCKLASHEALTPHQLNQGVDAWPLCESSERYVFHLLIVLLVLLVDCCHFPLSYLITSDFTLKFSIYHAAHSAVVLKAESAADKAEWLNKLRNVIQPSGQVKGESGLTMRQSLSDGSLVSPFEMSFVLLFGCLENFIGYNGQKTCDPEEELRWMSQEVRGYVEAVLNSLAANVPKAVVLCQVEKSKEDMLNQLYSSVRLIAETLRGSAQEGTNHLTPKHYLNYSIPSLFLSEKLQLFIYWFSVPKHRKIEELLQEDQNVKRRRERNQKQSSLLAKLTKQLSIHDNRAAAASSSWSNGGAESSPRTPGPSSGDDWRSAFDAAANGPTDSYSNSSRSGANGHSRRYSDPSQNGDANSGPNSGSRRTPNRLPPAPPQSGSSYRY